MKICALGVIRIMVINQYSWNIRIITEKFNIENRIHHDFLSFYLSKIDFMQASVLDGR